MTAAPLRSGSIPVSARRSAATLVGLALTVVAVASLESLLLPVLPLVQSEFGVDAETGALAPVALTLTTVIVTPLAGRFADALGARRTFVVIGALVALGGLISALSGVFPLFVVGQVLQGFGLGLLPISFVVLRQILTPERIKTATGILMAMTVVGSAIGVVTAGPIAESLSRAALYIIPTLFLMAGGIVFVAAHRHDAALEGSAPTRIDWLGALLLSLGLVALVAWISASSAGGWLSPAALILLVVTALVAVGWVIAERRVPEPMVDLRMLARRPMWVAVTVGIAMGWAYGTIVYLVPQQLALPRATGFGAGENSTTTGLYLALGFAVAIVAAPLAGRIGAAIGLAPLALAGQLLLTAGCLVAATMSGQATVIVSLVLLGLGAAATSTAVFALAATTVEAHQVGVATALTTIARALGAAIGTQVAATLITSDATSGAFTTAYVTGAIAAMAGAALALPLLRRASPQQR